MIFFFFLQVANPWHIDAKNVSLTKKLGSGACGEVFLSFLFSISILSLTSFSSFSIFCLRTEENFGKDYSFPSFSSFNISLCFFCFQRCGKGRTWDKMSL